MSYLFFQLFSTSLKVCFLCPPRSHMDSSFGHAFLSLVFIWLPYTSTSRYLQRTMGVDIVHEPVQKVHSKTSSFKLLFPLTSLYMNYRCVLLMFLQLIFPRYAHKYTPRGVLFMFTSTWVLSWDRL